jgi:hypothetical protein
MDAVASIVIIDDVPKDRLGAVVELRCSDQLDVDPVLVCRECHACSIWPGPGFVAKADVPALKYPNTNS